MKYLIYALIACSLGLIIYNVTKLDFSNLLGGDSNVAVISILAGMCAILLLVILLISKTIAKKAK